MVEQPKQLAQKAERFAAIVLVILVFAFITYQLTYTQILIQSPISHRITHFGFAFSVVFLSLFLRKERSGLLICGLLIATIMVTIYFMLSWSDIQQYRPIPNSLDVTMGIIAILLASIATYLVWGKVLLIIAATFLAYAIFGRFLPFPFTVAPVPLGQFIGWLSFPGVEEGVYGEILSMSSNYLFLFVFFGAALYAFGALRFVMSLSQWVGGMLRSGPAAVAIASSSLLGTMTGSTAANITITGAFTIPMMKKSGYAPEQAGAIEAAASNGGQIMPPIMGAAAFVMSGFTGIPYIKIVVAAIVPALLYFAGLFLYAELTARKLRITVTKMPISGRQMLLDAPLFFIPLSVLTFLLIIGYSLPFVGFWAIMSLIAVATITSLRKEARLNVKEVFNRLIDGVRTASSIAIMTALVGVLVTCIKVSGLGIKLPILIQDISQGHLIIALLIGMVSSILLGMGVNTVAAYLLVAIGLSPALIQMGVPLLQAHLFPFIFAIFSHLTPPIAIGVMIASRLAVADYWKTAIEALKIAFTAFLLPFFIIYVPIIILRPEGGLFLSITQLTAIILGIISLQVALSNYFNIGLQKNERYIFLVAALFCLAFTFLKVYPYFYIGIALFAISVIRQIIRRNQLNACLN